MPREWCPASVIHVVMRLFDAGCIEMRPRGTTSATPAHPLHIVIEYKSAMEPRADSHILGHGRPVRDADDAPLYHTNGQT